MPAPSQRLQPARIALAVLLWVGAGAVGLVLLIGHRDPAGVGAVVAWCTALFWQMVIAAGFVGSIAALLWPPFLPWLRVKWSRTRDTVDHDASAVREAAARLEHFDNGPDRMTIGKELVARRDFARAIPPLERAVELDPDSLAARQLLGRALLGAGQAERAAEVLGEVIRREEDHAFGDSLWALGQALVAAGRGDDAERVLARHEERFGALRAVDVLRADLAAARGDAARARELLTRAARKPEGERKLPPEEALARGRARVRLWTGGGAR